MSLKLKPSSDIHPFILWDLATRVFHWSLAFSVFGLLVSGLIGGAALQYHFLLGYWVASLLVFRVIWGFIGGYWSRFTVFFPTVKRWRQYKLNSNNWIGHTPPGAFAIFVMLMILFAQVASGLISDDEVINQGPLAHLAPSLWVEIASHYHRLWGKYLVFGIVVAHLCAIAWYQFWQKRILIKPMWSGVNQSKADQISSKDSIVMRAIAVCIFSLAVVFVYWLIHLDF
jgi:cytochrome b